nr:ATP-binding cassette domain-containing protein [Butyrivibrio sp.]
MAVVKCDNVSVIYKTGDFKAIGLKEYVLRHMTGNYNVKEFYADKHISFALKRGDMLGIIGTNGAGKSTLLKAITGILTPKEGKIKTKGRIAAFLELASGFDPEMTIKENTYLRGAMLGYTKDYIDERYSAIVEFA